jgi:arabinofuranan 3-O-arabinosyltransferase
VSAIVPWAKRRGGELLYAAVTVVLLLRTRPGRVGIDTKQYLFLEPGRLLEDAASLWNPGTAFGTVPHQSVGFLWPMAPFFWAGETVGLPDWVTQRLWLAGLLVAAGLGVLAAARELGLGSAGAWAAALVVAWSPYSLGYVHRTSVLLLPWAGLGWMLLFAIRSVRRGGWRDPCAFGLVALTVGGANATAFLLAGLAPALWVALAALDRSIGWRRALSAGARIAAVTAGASLWWLVALLVQGRYSLNVLRYSETLDAVALSTSTLEALRGLGYWLFYGRDRLEPWIEPAPAYQTSISLLVVTFLVPSLGLLALATTRWRHQAFTALLVLVGLALATGAHPWEAPSLLGSLFKEIALSSDAGLALRSSSRAVPLLVLGLALALGAAVHALGRRDRRLGMGGAVLAGAVALAAFPPLWQGTLVAENLSRPEDIPDAWEDAAAWLDAQPHDTRILEVPGIDLTFHRWGAVWEPITPGLVDRPYAARELIPYGGAGSVDLLEALDRRMQEGTIDPTAIGPIARLLGAGDVVLRSDLEYERYRTPRPRVLWDLLRQPGTGLEEPVAFGPPTANVAGPDLPLLDEIELRTPDRAADPPAVAAFPVAAARPLLRAEPAAGALLVAGSGEGLVDAAAIGLLDEPGLVLYAASHADDRAALHRLVDDSTDLLVTDSNRRRALRWRTLRDNAGYTETAAERPLVEDLSDARLDLFPHAGDDSRSVTVVTGARARATAYGNTVTYTPDVRPQLVLDGDVATSWRVGAFGGAEGQRLRIDLADPLPIDEITVLQDQRPGARAIGRVALLVDGQAAGEVRLDARSLTAPGQAVPIPSDDPGPVSTIELQILDTYQPGGGPSLAGPSVGLAELRIPGVDATEAVRLPVDLLQRSDGRRLAISLARLRSDPAEVVRGDDETHLARLLELPSRRSFGLAGTARLSARASDDLLRAALGVTGPVVTASDTLAGDLASRPWAATDGDPATRWRPGFGDQVGRWIETDLAGTTSVDHLDLELVADGRHSVPTRLVIEAGGTSRVVELPAVADSPTPGATVPVPVTFEPVVGDRLRVTVDAVRTRTTRDWYSLADVSTPIGIAELGVPGAARSGLPGEVPSLCRDDLLEVDGHAVPVRVTGRTDDALRLGGLAVEPCDSAALTLPSGTVTVAGTPGVVTGIDLDAVVLTSEADGRPAAEPLAPLGQPPGSGVADDGPTLDVRSTSATEHRVTVITGAEPAVVVLGENRNAGWHATVDGLDLGPPQLVDGYANGWVIPASDQPVDVRLSWTPQRQVRWGFAGSLLTTVGCLVVLSVGARRRRRPAPLEIGPDGAHQPELTLLVGRASLAWPGTAAFAVGAGVVAAVVSTPVVGLVLAAGAVVASRGRWGRLLVAGAGLACVAAAVGHLVVGQRRHRWPADFDWPTHGDDVHHLVWCGVLLVLVVVLVDAARQRLREPGEGSN